MIITVDNDALTTKAIHYLLFSIVTLVSVQERSKRFKNKDKTK